MQNFWVLFETVNDCFLNMTRVPMCAKAAQPSQERISHQCRVFRLHNGFVLEHRVNISGNHVKGAIEIRAPVALKF